MVNITGITYITANQEDPDGLQDTLIAATDSLRVGSANEQILFQKHCWNKVNAIPCPLKGSCTGFRELEAGAVFARLEPTVDHVMWISKAACASSGVPITTISVPGLDENNVTHLPNQKCLNQDQ